MKLYIEAIVVISCASFVLAGVAPIQQIQSRIVNGDPVIISRFPWYASLHVTYTNNQINYCGGSIISETFVLTSADCIANAKTIKINMGSALFSQPAKTLQSTVYYVHPNYNSVNFQNNIALIKLPSALVFSSSLSAIQLVARSQVNETYINSPAYLSGFGVTSNNNKTMSERLQFVKQRIISNNECQSHYQPQMVQVPQICAIGWDHPWQSGCFGDGGGPLVTDYCGVWTQIAVMSFIHINGCEDARPTGFSRISSYFDWISKTANYAFRP